MPGPRHDRHLVIQQRIPKRDHDLALVTHPTFNPRHERHIPLHRPRLAVPNHPVVDHPRIKHRSRKDDPLYRARRTLYNGVDLLTEKQKDRLTALFATHDHIEVEAT